jgi:hypothetical protein
MGKPNSTWECWVYHPTEGRRVVTVGEARKLCAEGWFDNPGKFTKVSALGLKDPTDAELQDVADAIQGIVDHLNGALNLHRMTKMQLSEYAAYHFGIELDRRKALAALRAEVKTMTEGTHPLLERSDGHGEAGN